MNTSIYFVALFMMVSGDYDGLVSTSRGSPGGTRRLFGLSRAEQPRESKNSIDNFQSVLVRYLLGMPETSLSGRNTRIARNVRRSISICMSFENVVKILLQKHTHPATFYYLLLYYTNTYATLKYLYYVHTLND